MFSERLQPHLFFLRHGQSAYNLWNIDQMSADDITSEMMPDEKAPLTQLGEQQAVELGNVWAALLKDVPGPLVALFSSSWLRAIQTARILAARINADRETLNEVHLQTPDPRLTEHHLGLTNPPYVKQYPELAERFDEYWKIRNTRPDGRMYEPPVPYVTPRHHQIALQLGLKGQVEIAGEAMIQTLHRVKNWLQDPQVAPIVTNTDRTSLVVGHGATIYGSLFALGLKPPDEIVEFMNLPQGDIPNASATAYAYNTQRPAWSLTAWGVEPAHQRHLFAQK